MTGPDTLDNTNSDLIDSIANALPAERRAGYYREMRHLRSLPENDEMLRILRIMQWHTAIAVEVPGRMAAEREKLDGSLHDAIQVSQQMLQRLDRLSVELVSEVSAEEIARHLYESLRQQFIQSTIPQTGRALAVVAGKIQESVDGLAETTPRILAAHEFAAHQVQRATGEMQSAISNVTATAREAMAELSSTFLHQYRWALGILILVALTLGLLSGIFLDRAGYLPW